MRLLRGTFDSRSLLGATFVLWAAGMVSGADDDKALRARFESEAPAAWETYRQTQRLVQGVSRGESVGSDVPRSLDEVEVKANQTCRLVRIVDSGTHKAELLAQNPKYWFRLKTGKDGAWVLTELYQGEELAGDRAKAIADRLEQSASLRTDQIVRLTPDMQPLGELLRSPGMRVTSVTAKPRDGWELVEVAFELPPSPPGQDRRVLLGGVLLLDPVRHWLPVSQTAFVRTLVGTGTHTSAFEFGPGPWPVVRREIQTTEYKLNSTPKPWQLTSTVDYELQIPAQLPDTSEFTLSAFGLPEPVGVTWEKPTPRYLWFLLAAGIFATLAIGFRYLARRRSAPTAAGS